MPEYHLTVVAIMRPSGSRAPLVGHGERAAFRPERGDAMLLSERGPGGGRGPRPAEGCPSLSVVNGRARLGSTRGPGPKRSDGGGAQEIHNLSICWLTAGLP